jgi:hypothetical protein
MAWDLLRTFPLNDLKQITPEIRNLFYSREQASKMHDPEAAAKAFLEADAARKKKDRGQ